MFLTLKVLSFGRANLCELILNVELITWVELRLLSMLALKNNRIFYASMKHEANHGIKNFQERRIVKNKFIRIESFVKRRINMK